MSVEELRSRNEIFFSTEFTLLHKQLILLLGEIVFPDTLSQHLSIFNFFATLTNLTAFDIALPAHSHRPLLGCA